jgi:spore coat polysaccharide biosynthesis protein SpsF (cytidylyltransferase family)
MASIIGCLLVEPVEACPLELDAVRQASNSLDGARRSTARPGTSRPLAQRSLAGKPLLEWVVRRASEAQQLDGLVVIVPATETVESFKQSLPAGVDVVHSTCRDRLGRLVEAIAMVERERTAGGANGKVSDWSAIRGIINLQLDCPLLDPCLLDQMVSSVRMYESVEYATYHSPGRSPRDGRPSIMHSQLGLFADFFQVSALQRLATKVNDCETRQDFERYVWAHPEEFTMRLLKLPEPLDCGDLRFSLRHQDDWAHAEQIVEALGHDHLDWQRIVGLLQSQPVLRERMASLNLAERRDLRA